MGVNSTFIALIPKMVAPTQMQDFRPISLCTVLYKCISKIIASRLKKIMSSMVDISQSAFIPDDMLFFSHRSKQYVQLIMSLIATFSGWSGLAPSISKSTSFLCNCDDGFTSWFDTLSIPRGRVMLIKSVVNAIEAFWCNHFMLPTLIYAIIQSFLTRFVWRGNINHKGGAKVAWNTICLPREEGSLGLKNMIDWNRAQILHHLLYVVTDSDSLWPKWVNASVLKNKHFWTLTIPTDCSWIWRKFLKHRRVALQFIT
ncbi:uncharacterized protein LOC141690446 [Apium graveolens]|uniref:uncharacterized protein LOC141690446 n=1 Tax=Apium graveolens TaxID=4045 RepID=UPI003D795200